MNKYQIELKNNGIEACLELLADNGHCPNLINDDNGHWALTGTGYQDVVTGKTPKSFMTSFFIEKKELKKTVLGAIKYYIKDIK